MINRWIEIYLELLYDKVEIVPAIVGEEAGVEGERDLGHVILRPVPREILSLDGWMDNWIDRRRD